MLDRTDRPVRKSRRKTRPERSAAPGQNPHLHVPFIRRRTPPYDILDPASLTRIEAAADRILAEIGIEFRDDPETVELFRKAGGVVTDHGENRWRIRFEPSNWNGLVTTPTVRTPSSRAACAMIGAAPVPVPPPMPAVMKHICAPAR